MITTVRFLKKPALGLITILLIIYPASCVFGAYDEATRWRSGGSAPSVSGGFFGGAIEGEYYIGAGDLLNVFVWKDPDLTMDVRVRSDGKFTYPLIGTIKASGLSIEALQNKMREELRKYIKYPEVTVSVKESAGTKVVVLGEVLYPGVYPYKGAIDVLTAIGLAGDFSETAKRESVLVISGNETGSPKVRRLNVFRSFRHGAVGPDFMLKPNDVVYVPKTFIADWNKTVTDLQPTFDMIANLMTVRTSIKTIYYNHDKPAKQVNQSN